MESVDVKHINTYTGNVEVDSIINSMADDIKGAGLVYNLLKNAVEACKKYDGFLESSSNQKWFKVEINI